MGLIVTRKSLLIIGVIIVGIVSAVVAFLTLRSSDAPPRAEPPYAAILPVGKTIEQLGGWNSLTPPSGETVFVFLDHIDNISINVSQQPLPASFQPDPISKLTEFAHKENATTPLQIKDSHAYIGTSATGPQSVIFIKNNLLIMIKSQDTIEHEDWIVYINNLQPS